MKNERIKIRKINHENRLINMSKQRYRLKNSGRPPSHTPNQNHYNYEALKSRLLQHLKKFTGFSYVVKHYMKDTPWNLKNNLEYVEKINLDLDGEVDCFVEETQKIENLLKTLKFKSIRDTEFEETLNSLVIFNEKEIATNLMQKIAEIDDSVYYNLYTLYKHFPESFSGGLGALKRRLVYNIRLDPVNGKFSEFSGNGRNYDVSSEINKFKKNPPKYAKKLILKYLEMKRDKYEWMVDDLYDDINFHNVLIYFIFLDEIEIARVGYEKLADKGDRGAPGVLNIIYTRIGAKKYENLEFKNLKLMEKARHLSHDETKRLVELYKFSDEKLKKENEELRKKVRDLEEKVTELTYRPGGPGFKSASKRQVGKFGLKR